MSITRRNFFGLMGQAAALPVLAKAIALEQRPDGRIVTVEPQEQILIPREDNSPLDYLSIPINQITEMTHEYRGLGHVRHYPSFPFDLWTMRLSVLGTPELARSVGRAFAARYSR